MTRPRLLELTRSHFPDATWVEAYGELTLTLPPEQILTALQALQDVPEFAFTQLIDLCAVDYQGYGQAEWETDTATRTGFARGVRTVEEAGLPDGVPSRYAVVYHLLSLTHNCRLRVKTYASGTPPRVPSVTGLWSCADWFEREAFDLYGVYFEGHPDLRRLLTDYGFIGHPFRKDFPLIGQVEMRYDPLQQRVVYEPVSIEPRVLVPRVIRAEERH
jgi:NADH-quinone oxidoreductase subunit C